LQIKQIIAEPQFVIERLKVKNFDAQSLVNQIVELDKKRRDVQKKLDDKKFEQNNISKQIGQLFKEGKQQEVEALKAQSVKLKDEISELEAEFEPIDKKMYELVVKLPNLPHTSVPSGKSAEDNVVVRQGGQIPTLSSSALPHWDLAKKYNLIDFELGNKITGAGFPLYIGKGSKLQRALISFFLDKATEAGFTEYEAPLMVNYDTAYATGQLPDKDEQMYYVERDKFYLIPTAEVPLTNIYRDVILEEEHLPIKLTGYTPCFRREAGSYGKDVRGLNRLHQFDKVEIVVLSKPEESYQMLEMMVNHVENLVKLLELPYRIVKLCGGDMSFTSALTFDFECYSTAQQKWLEVSSVSNFETFQSNRLKLRYKPQGSKNTVLAHTLNGSALALPRIVASLLENNQTEKGIKIPKVLVPYTGFEYID